MSKLDLTRRGALLAGVGAGAAGCATEVFDEAPGGLFLHGVASGDPLSDRVVIWTRVSNDSRTSIPVDWLVAEDPSFERVVASGAASAESIGDYCVKVDVGGLAPGRVYYYRFRSGPFGASPVGRTRTLPAGAVDRLTLAVFSCSNYPFGRFHAYADMAARGDVDFALHVGDYIYETGGESGWGWAESQANGRIHEPRREIVTLADYRTRYAQYRSDPDLQAAHAAAPWILAWDDHEITNNPWKDGAQNHNPERGEGTWEDRKAAALRAWFEWMPVREIPPGGAREAIWRRLDFGDLATMVVLETRLTGRDEQLDYARDLPFLETAYRMGDEGRMEVVPADQLVPTPPPGVERLPTPFDLRGPKAIPVLDYRRAKALDEAARAGGLPRGYAYRRDVEGFRAKLLDPERRMIDPAQEAWLLESVAHAHERGVRWQLVGTQIVFARQELFDLARFYDAAALEALVARSASQAGQIERGRLGLPWNLDAWDGYPVQRDRIADALSSLLAHPIFLSGDTHAFWANEVSDSKGALCGAELGGTAVSSPGYSEYDGMSPPIGEVLAAGFGSTRFADVRTRGYLLLTLTPDEALCDMIGTNDPDAPEPGARVVARWSQRRRGAAGVLPPLVKSS